MRNSYLSSKQYGVRMSHKVLNLLETIHITSQNINHNCFSQMAWVLPRLHGSLYHLLCHSVRRPDQRHHHGGSGRPLHQLLHAGNRNFHLFNFISFYSFIVPNYFTLYVPFKWRSVVYNEVIMTRISASSIYVYTRYSSFCHNHNFGNQRD